MTQQDYLSKLNEKTSLIDIQTYIKKVIDLRGLGKQSAQANMLLLLEEVGELAKAIRKSSPGMSVDKSMLQRYETVEGEVADVFIVLVSICNTLNINLYDVFIEKEELNIGRVWTINKNTD